MSVNAIKVFEPGSEELSRLQNFADKANKILGTYGETLVPEVTYFDFGQGWKWTTLIAYDSNGDSWQALNPRQQGDILEGKDENKVLKALIDFAQRHTDFIRSQMLKNLG